VLFFPPIDSAWEAWRPNGLEMSRPASSSIVSQTRFAAAGRVGSIELLGGAPYEAPNLASRIAAVRTR